MSRWSRRTVKAESTSATSSAVGWPAARSTSPAGQMATWGSPRWCRRGDPLKAGQDLPVVPVDRGPPGKGQAHHAPLVSEGRRGVLDEHSSVGFPPFRSVVAGGIHLGQAEETAGAFEAQCRTLRGRSGETATKGLPGHSCESKPCFSSCCERGRSAPGIGAAKRADTRPGMSTGWAGLCGPAGSAPRRAGGRRKTRRWRRGPPPWTGAPITTCSRGDGLP